MLRSPRPTNSITMNHQGRRNHFRECLISSFIKIGKRKIYNKNPLVSVLSMKFLNQIDLSEKWSQIL